MVIGIAGGSGAGKTTIVNMLQEYYRSNISVINMDNYYYSFEEITFEERKKINFDHPRTIDIELLIKNLTLLKNNKTVLQPVYSIENMCRSTNVVETSPSDIIVVEGIFALYYEKLRELYDIAVYIDVETEYRFARRVLREVNQYGRPLEFVVKKYLEQTKVMHDRYVNTSKIYADIIIPFVDRNEKGMMILKEFIVTHFVKTVFC